MSSPSVGVERAWQKHTERATAKVVKLAAVRRDIAPSSLSLSGSFRSPSSGRRLIPRSMAEMGQFPPEFDIRVTSVQPPPSW